METPNQAGVLVMHNESWRRFRVLSVWITLCTGALQTIVVAQERVESGKDRSDEAVRANVERLISQLGADEFAKREEATNQLRAVGEELLFKPDLNDEKDLSTLSQFHDCFMVPLDNARVGPDAEARQRARTLFSEFSPGHLIGEGADGWALYAIHRLLPELPESLSASEYFRKFGKPAPRKTMAEESLEGVRRQLRRDIERLTLIKRSLENPEGVAQSIVEGTYDTSSPPTSLAIVATVWARTEFDAALKYCSGLHQADPYGVSKNAFTRLIEAWPEDHPRDAALQWIADYQDDERRIWWPEIKFYEIAKRYAQDEPEKAFLWACSIKSPEIRGGMLATVVRTVSQFNNKLANELASRVEEQEIQDNLHVSLLRCAIERGEKVSDAAIEAIADARSRDSIRSVMVDLMAKSDPESAVKLADKISRSVSKKNRYSNIAELWGRRDEAAALKWISTIEDESLRGWCMEGLVQGLSTKNLPRAVELAKTIRHPAYHRTAIGYVVRELAKSDPYSALALLKTTDYPERALWRVRGNIIEIWAGYAPISALKWVADQQAETLTVTWYRELAKSWARMSPTNAARWAASLQSFEARVFALVGMVEGLLPNADVTDKFGVLFPKVPK